MFFPATDLEVSNEQGTTNKNAASIRSISLAVCVTVYFWLIRSLVDPTSTDSIIVRGPLQFSRLQVYAGSVKDNRSVTDLGPYLKWSFTWSGLGSHIESYYSHGVLFSFYLAFQ